MRAAYGDGRAPEGTPLAPARIVGGIGGLVFVASVVAQNLLRSAMPANDARASTITRFYADHRSTEAVLAVLFALGAVGLATFTGALLTRLRGTTARGPAIGGAVGVGGVIAMFSTTVAVDLALSAYVHRGHADPGVVTGLWLVHAAAFGVLAIFLGIALAALAAASAADGLVGAAWKSVGLVGGVLLLVGGAATPAVIDGSGIMAVALVGFLVWLVFLTAASIALLRATPQPARDPMLAASSS